MQDEPDVRRRPLWKTEMERLGLDTAKSRTWDGERDLMQIVEIARAFSRAQWHWFMPDDGGPNASHVWLGDGTLDLRPAYDERNEITIRLTPRALRFEYIRANPINSFFRLVLDPFCPAVPVSTKHICDDRYVRHVRSGSILLASKWGIWNQIPAAYDALHLRFTDSEIRSICALLQQASDRGLQGRALWWEIRRLGDRLWKKSV